MGSQEWGRGSFVTDTTKHFSVPVTDAAPVALGASTPPTDMRRATLRNIGPNTVYMGGSDVTSPAGANRGFPVEINGSLDLVAHPSRTWAICAAGESATLIVIGA